MNRHGKLLVAAVLMAGVTSPALAEKHAVGARFGLLGMGVEYTYTLNDRISIRGGLNGSKLGFDATESGIDYDFDFIWDSISVGVDYHPTRKPLRLSVGFLQNDNRLEAISRPADDLNVGGTTYTPAEVGTLSAVAGFDSTAPFAGIGWDWSRSNRRVGMTLDIGVISQGAPYVRLNASGTLLGDTAFQSDLAAEQAELEASLDDFDLMPYGALGVVFRF